MTLSYLQVGLLISIPVALSGLFEPALGILSDIRRRRTLVLGGGVLFAGSVIMTGVSHGFWLLLLSFVLFYPASGAFVSLSQAELMDRAPSRRDQNMARWTFAGSVGAVAGPLALSLLAGKVFRYGSTRSAITPWRGLYLAAAAAAAGMVILAARFAFPPGRAPRPRAAGEHAPGFLDGLRGALAALKNPEVLRWLALLELANLMLDVLMGFIALYFVDAARASSRQAALAVTLWTGAGVIGDLALIPLLERMGGLRYLRASAAAVAVVFPCFLLVQPFAAKLALIALVGLLRAGWYAILQARLYGCLPGRSGAALALGNVSGLAGALIPIGVSALAQAAGIRAAMWTLMAAPVALLAALPRRRE